MKISLRRLDEFFYVQLKNIKQVELVEGQNIAMSFTLLKNFSDLNTQVRRALLGFFVSDKDLNRRFDQTEICIGAALSEQLNKQLTSCMKRKKHDYGVILGFSELSRVKTMELTGVKLLKKLKKTGSLCVHNYIIRGFDESLHAKADCGDLVFYYMTAKRVT